MKPAREHATYDDVLKAPETLVAELIEGDLYTSPRPAIPYTRSASALAQDLRSFDGPPGDPDQPGGWWILVEPELHFGADVSGGIRLLPARSLHLHIRHAAVLHGELAR